MRGLERRLCSLEAIAEPSKGFKIRNLRDLVEWGAMPEGTPLDLSECDDALLRLIIDATKEEEASHEVRT